MKRNEVAHILYLLNSQPPTDDPTICSAFGYEPRSEEYAAKFADLVRRAAAYRTLDPSVPDIERGKLRQSIRKPGIRLPPFVRDCIFGLAGFPKIETTPKPAPPTMTATERLEDAVANERRKPYAEQRHALVRKWLEELEALRDTHDEIYATA